MIDINDFRNLIIVPSLKIMDMWSPSAELLMLGTALCESSLKYLKQHPGPAIGLFEMESATFYDLQTYLKRYPQMRASLLAACYFEIMPPAEAMIHNLRFATLMARIKYWRDKEPLPRASEIEKLGAYYKRVYNTENGAGSISHFVEMLTKYGNLDASIQPTVQ